MENGKGVVNTKLVIHGNTSYLVKISNSLMNYSPMHLQASPNMAKKGDFHFMSTLLCNDKMIAKELHKCCLGTFGQMCIFAHL